MRLQILHESFRSDQTAKPHDGGQWIILREDGKRQPLMRFWGMKRVAEMHALAVFLNLEIAAERERCARIVESYANTEPDRAIAAAAAEIRGGK